jgi:hypothetical protein
MALTTYWELQIYEDFLHFKSFYPTEEKREQKDILGYVIKEKSSTEFKIQHSSCS